MAAIGDAAAILRNKAAAAVVAVKQVLSERHAISPEALWTQRKDK